MFRRIFSNTHRFISLNHHASKRFIPNINRTYASYKRFGGGSQQGGLPNIVEYWKQRWQWGASIFVVSGVIYVVNLEEAPYSHRRRFMIVPRSVEIKVGNSNYKQVMREFGNHVLPENHPEHKRVDEVMRKLLDSSDDFPKDVEWKVHVINAPNQPPNAFVLPNGKVFVFTSILPICKNDDGLATVLGHEASHQLAKHSMEQLSKSPIYIALGLALWTITGSDYINRILINSLLQLPASREMEREADYIGLMLMSRACYNPEEASKLWVRMQEFERQQKMGGGIANLEFLSTHPSSANRIELLKGWLPEAKELQSRANCYHTSGEFADFARQWGF